MLNLRPASNIVKSKICKPLFAEGRLPIYTVAFIKDREGGRVSVGVVSDGESRTLNISAQLYSSMSFTRGSTLTSDEAEVLLSDDERYRAMSKALSLLAHSDKNSRALYLRLLREGFSREVAAEAVERCISLGYINERGQLRRLILREANTNLHGPRYIRRKLASKGYSLAEIDEVTDILVSDGEIDFDANLARLAEKKGLTDPDEISALAYKQGYYIN